MSKVSKRKFYKTVISVTVLSEEPFEYENLSQVIYAIGEGDCSGEYHTTEAKVITARQVVRALKAQGSDPDFFQLNEKGQDI